MKRSLALLPKQNSVIHFINVLLMIFVALLKYIGPVINTREIFGGNNCRLAFLVPFSNHNICLNQKILIFINLEGGVLFIMQVQYKSNPYLFAELLEFVILLEAYVQTLGDNKYLFIHVFVL